MIHVDTAAFERAIPTAAPNIDAATNAVEDIKVLTCIAGDLIAQSRTTLEGLLANLPLGEFLQLEVLLGSIGRAADEISRELGGS